MSRHPDPAVELLVQRQAIADLVNRYADAVDRRDMRAVASCFAADVDASEWGGFTDRDALVAYISGVGVFHTTMHMMGNRFIAVDGDTARVTSHATLTHHGHHRDGSVWELNGTDRRYVEDLRRDADGWVIVRRSDRPRYDVDDLARVTTADPDVRWLLDRAALYDLVTQRALDVDLPAAGATEHFLGTHLARIEGDRATSETAVLVTERGDGPAGPEESTLGVLRWRTGAHRVDGRWVAIDGDAPPLDTTPRGARRSQDPAIQGLLDRALIDDVVVTSVRALDRRAWDDLGACFADPSALDDIRAAEDGWAGSDHLVNNHVVHVEGDRATSEAYAYVVHHDADDAPTPWSHGARRLVDDLVRTSDGWRIARRRVLANHIRPAT